MLYEKKYGIGKWGYYRYCLYVLVGVFSFLFAACTPVAPVNQANRLSPTPNPIVPTPGPTATTLAKIAPRISTPSIPIPAAVSTPVIPHIEPGDWPSYLLDNQRDSFNQSETIINPTTAPNLQQYWTYHAQGGISVQPVEANHMIYWGSWDGFEHATKLDGEEVWETNIGETTDDDPTCDPNSVGVASTATIVPIVTGGTTTLVDLVGGGNANFYALNASTGKVIWQASLGSSPQNFIWSSPTVYHGSVYVGLSSFGDCPGSQGELVQLSTTSGAVQNIFYVVPGGCLGGGVWGSATIDTRTGALYFATGNPDSCWTTEIYAISIIELQASNLAFVDSWQVPSSDQVFDGDFGSTPTLFTATIGGSSHSMVGAINKNGIFYAFDRKSLSNGPLWSDQIAYTSLCPTCEGPGTFSPAAWDGSRLYVGGANTTIHGNNCPGSLRALNPATGHYIWERCLLGDRVLGAVITVPGVVVVTEGASVVLVSASTGKILFSFKDTNRGSIFYGSASIAHGRLYVGNMDGNLYAFALYQTPPASMS